jgi:hypothetical protein
MEHGRVDILVNDAAGARNLRGDSASSALSGQSNVATQNGTPARYLKLLKN